MMCRLQTIEKVQNYPGSFDSLRRGKKAAPFAFGKKSNFFVSIGIMSGARLLLQNGTYVLKILIAYFTLDQSRNKLGSVKI